MSGFSRAERLGDEINHALARALLFEVRDERLRNVSITAVKLTGDLRDARVYWVPLSAEKATERDRKRIGRALDRASGFLRTYLAKNLTLRHAPELTFFFDESLERGRTMENLLADLVPDGQAATERAERAGEDDDGEPGNEA